MDNSYSWAVNRIKLSQAISAVKATGGEETDAAVQAEYVKRGGLLASDAKIHKAKKPPRVTSNKIKISVQEK